MRAFSSTLVTAAAMLLSAQTAYAREGGKAGSLFKSLFGVTTKERTVYADPDQAALVDWLVQHDFQEYSSKEWIERWDDELDYDCIEDFTYLVADEEYEEIGIPLETAKKMQDAARRTMMEKFLAAVPIPEEADEDVFTKLINPLIAQGYDEPETVADLTEQDAKQMAMDTAHYNQLVTYGAEWEIRELLHMILITFDAGEGQANPFEHRGVRKPMIDALLKSGVKKLEDIYTVPVETTEYYGIQKNLLQALKRDPRVSAHEKKQEL